MSRGMIAGRASLVRTYEEKLNAHVAGSPGILPEALAFLAVVVVVRFIRRP